MLIVDSSLTYGCLRQVTPALFRAARQTGDVPLYGERRTANSEQPYRGDAGGAEARVEEVVAVPQKESILGNGSALAESRSLRLCASAPLRLSSSQFAVRGSRFVVRGSRFAVRGSRFAVRSLPAASLTATMESRRRRGRRGSCRTGRCGSPKERILGNGSALAESRPLRPCASAPLR